MLCYLLIVKKMSLYVEPFCLSFRVILNINHCICSVIDENADLSLAPTFKIQKFKIVCSTCS